MLTAIMLFYVICFYMTAAPKWLVIIACANLALNLINFISRMLLVFLKGVLKVLEEEDK